VGRPPIKKTGPMTGAELQARYRKRKRKSINLKARREYQKDKEAPQRAARAAAPPLPAGATLRIGDAREVADTAPDQIPLIVTDPPYGHAAAPLYRWLAPWSKRVLIPGGHLVVYVGSTLLPRDLGIFSDASLRFRGECILLFNPHQRLWGNGLLVKHRSVLVFSKGPPRLRLPSGRLPLLPTVLPSSGPNKSLHDWQLGDAGVRTLINCLSDPEELILDPFAGSCEWGRLAVEMGRNWEGCDVVPGGVAKIVA
jgi:site-specific DNA-methyltransferase (adenine-specific)